MKTMFKDKYDITFDFIQTQTIQKKAGVKRREEKIIKKQVLINKIDDDHQHYAKFV